jgi:hypothetical protein
MKTQARLTIRHLSLRANTRHQTPNFINKISAASIPSKTTPLRVDLDKINNKSHPLSLPNQLGMFANSNLISM